MVFLGGQYHITTHSSRARIVTATSGKLVGRAGLIRTLALMTISTVVVVMIIGWGALGIIGMRSALRSGASETIDSPGRFTRYWHRFWLLGFSFLFSFMITPAAVLQFLPEIDLRAEPEVVRLAVLLAYPIPLAALFFWLLVKASRWAARRLGAGGRTIHASPNRVGVRLNADVAVPSMSRTTVASHQRDALLQETMRQLDAISDQIDAGVVSVEEGSKRADKLIKDTGSR